MAKIKSIAAHEILNSAGRPSLEVTVTLSDNTIAISSCPSGESVGGYEAVNLIDRDESRYGGYGVLKAVANVTDTIAPKLIGMEATKQQDVDKTMIELDGTQNKSRLGANAMLSVSMAVAKAAATSSVLPLFLYLREFVSSRNTPAHIPTPLFNLMNGNPQLQNALDFEDFIVIPASSKTFSESLQMGSKLYYGIWNALRTNNIPVNIGPRGGFEPLLRNNTDGLILLEQSLEASSLHIGFDVFLGIDSNATTFYKNQQYKIKDSDATLKSKDLNSFYTKLIKEHHLLYLEDPLAEDDWDGWSELTKNSAQDSLIVGDDLIATNLYRLQMAIDKKAVTGIVIKPNQIGTVLEALAVVEVARTAGLKIVVASRAEETNDDFIADFAVAASSDYIKFGPPTQGQHVAKYNRLLQIESQLKML